MTAAAVAAAATDGEKTRCQNEQTAYRVEVTRRRRRKGVGVSLQDCCKVWMVGRQPARMGLSQVAVGKGLAAHEAEYRETSPILAGRGALLCLRRDTFVKPSVNS